jgi:hypothetical protein
MPWPNSPSSTGEPRGTNYDGFEDFNRRFDKPHYSEFQSKDSLSSLKDEAMREDEELRRKQLITGADIVETNASKELGKITIFLKERFPELFYKMQAEGKTISEIVEAIQEMKKG